MGEKKKRKRKIYNKEKRDPAHLTERGLRVHRDLVPKSTVSDSETYIRSRNILVLASFLDQHSSRSHLPLSFFLSGCRRRRCGWALTHFTIPIRPFLHHCQSFRLRLFSGKWRKISNKASNWEFSADTNRVYHEGVGFYTVNKCSVLKRK